MKLISCKPMFLASNTPIYVDADMNWNVPPPVLSSDPDGMRTPIDVPDDRDTSL